MQIFVMECQVFTQMTSLAQKEKGRLWKVTMLANNIRNIFFKTRLLQGLLKLLGIPAYLDLTAQKVVSALQRELMCWA